MDSSEIQSNSAAEGGGAYFEFQKTPVSPPYLSYLYNTSIQYNSADTLGGGIFYQGYEPYISTNTTIADNSAGKDFLYNIFFPIIHFFLLLFPQTTHSKLLWLEFLLISEETAVKFNSQHARNNVHIHHINGFRR